LQQFLDGVDRDRPVLTASVDRVLNPLELAGLIVSRSGDLDRLVNEPGFGNAEVFGEAAAERPGEDQLAAFEAADVVFAVAVTGDERPELGLAHATQLPCPGDTVLEFFGL
jgi:hypothetical protein